MMFLRMKRARLPRRAGEWVEVRSKEEILATLDPDGTYEKLPFMPEMLQFCGQRFRIAAVAHKTCDPAHKTGGRRMRNAVHLEQLRCDGSAHDGCQANCLLFWKTAWLKPVDAPPDQHADSGLAEEQLIATARIPTASMERPVYSCQATRLFDATTPLNWWDPLQYVRDLTSRNVTPRHALKVLTLAAARALVRFGVGYRLTRMFYEWLHAKLMGRPAPRTGGEIPRGQPTPRIDLKLQPGELVRVRANEAILSTLNVDNKNRGMWFDEEMVVFCGGTYRVKARVERIINEVTGEMMEMKSPCITLEGVSCRALYSRHRLFCPRAITPYWRENWLERASGEPGSP
jgi:hypothetical protein